MTTITRKKKDDTNLKESKKKKIIVQIDQQKKRGRNIMQENPSFCLTNFVNLQYVIE